MSAEEMADLIQRLRALADRWNGTYPDPNDDYDCGYSAGHEQAAEELLAVLASDSSSSEDPPEQADLARSSYCVEGWHAQCGSCGCKCHDEGSG